MSISMSVTCPACGYRQRVRNIYLSGFPKAHRCVNCGVLLGVRMAADTVRVKQLKELPPKEEK